MLGKYYLGAFHRVFALKKHFFLPIFLLFIYRTWRCLVSDSAYYIQSFHLVQSFHLGSYWNVEKPRIIPLLLIKKNDGKNVREYSLPVGGQLFCGWLRDRYLIWAMLGVFFLGYMEISSLKIFQVLIWCFFIFNCRYVTSFLDCSVQSIIKYSRCIVYTPQYIEISLTVCDARANLGSVGSVFLVEISLAVCDARATWNIVSCLCKSWCVFLHATLSIVFAIGLEELRINITIVNRYWYERSGTGCAFGGRTIRPGTIVPGRIVRSLFICP